jgi:tripartite-type tricarboxylate transporter receptor subunit TctC
MWKKESVRGFAAMALAAFSLGQGAAARAEDASAYPSRPVTIVVPFGPGGSADVYARVLAEKLGRETGKSFIVENRPGAGAVIGTQFVAKAPPDGYTLLMMSNTQTVNESLLRQKPYELMRDFVAVAPVNEAPLVLVVRSGLAPKTLPELVRQAKAAPGKLNYASSGTGTPYHMAGELFKSMAGIDVVHIPYKSSGGARTDVLGGQVDLMFDAVTTMSEQARAGKVKALATTGLMRSTVMPDVPTVAEAGVPKYEATIWLGLMAPKATPPAIVARLNAEVGRIVGSAETARAWTAQGATPMTMGVPEFTRYLNDDIAKWARIVKLSGAKVDE